MKSDEARARLIHAGMEHLRNAEPRVVFPLLALPELIAKAGVPRATAYRLFAEPDREVAQTFADAVVCALADDFLKTTWTIRPAWFNAMVAEAQALGVSGDVAGLEEVGHGNFAVGLHEAITFVRHDLGSLLVVGGCATLSIHNASDELIQALDDVRTALSTQLRSLLRECFASFGLIVRRPWTLELLATALLDLTIMHIVRSHHEGGTSLTGRRSSAEVLRPLLGAVIETAVGSDKRMVVSPNVGRMLRPIPNDGD